MFIIYYTSTPYSNHHGPYIKQGDVEAGRSLELFTSITPSCDVNSCCLTGIQGGQSSDSVFFGVLFVLSVP